ncbi:hypothetical protein A3H10_00635 [Candidatus Uhrbacteria bacterium RIFCSPLOWO2_12_FULL_46_10]|nr:MAG: hypothetical protein A3H10_00635 [Candidatus Uhrbacteria bacterium RIFCSPLOWO2_12_FULL_46_10]HLD86129.1 RluA family pseudouridine synthase [Patescibacteria group bacterium]
MIKQKFEVPAEFRDKRLDIFLTAVLKLTRSQVQKMIRKGLVKVNDKTPSVHHWLKEGDEICVEERMMAPKISPQEPPLDIAAETNDYMVIIKPVGVITHPAAGSSALALTDVLVKHNPGMALVGEASRPGIVHRLDRDVGGLLVVAKTQKMYDELQRQFKERLVKKKYTALVEGVVPQAEGVLDFVMARSKTYPGRMAARPKGQEGRVAETCYTVIKKFPHRTLLELELVTGRTHQIRAHLKAFRHPIVGDKLYGTRKKNAKKPVSDLNHPFLQATTLGFFDLNGEWQEFTVPLESELQNFLNTLS